MSLFSYSAPTLLALDDDLIADGIILLVALGAAVTMWVVRGRQVARLRRRVEELTRYVAYLDEADRLSTLTVAQTLARPRRLSLAPVSRIASVPPLRGLLERLRRRPVAAAMVAAAVVVAIGLVALGASALGSPRIPPDMAGPRPSVPASSSTTQPEPTRTPTPVPTPPRPTRKVEEAGDPPRTVTAEEPRDDEPTQAPRPRVTPRATSSPTPTPPRLPSPDTTTPNIPDPPPPAPPVPPRPKVPTPPTTTRATVCALLVCVKVRL